MRATVRHMAAEVISTVERRRRWPAEDKLRIMSEALEPGAVVAAVADRNGVCRSQLYTWLRLARDDRLPGISITPQPASFVPVRVRPLATSAPANGPPPSPPPDTRPALASRRRTSVVEVVLGNGRSLKVEESIDPAALARLVDALDGRFTISMVPTMPSRLVKRSLQAAFE